MARRNVRPTQLAAALGVLPQTVSRWRRGELPDDLRFPVIAGYLRIRADWLRLGVGEIEPEIHSGGPSSPVERRTGEGTPPRSPGRRADDLRKDTARLAYLVDLMAAYRKLGRVADPGEVGQWEKILAEYLDVARANPPDPGSSRSGPAGPPFPPAGGPGPL